MAALSASLRGASQVFVIDRSWTCAAARRPSASPGGVAKTGWPASYADDLVRVTNPTGRIGSGGVYMPLEVAPEAYREFDRRGDGCTRVILGPERRAA